VQVRDAQEAIERLEREVAASNKLAEDLAANKTRLEDTRKSAAQAEDEHKKVIQELQVRIMCHQKWHAWFSSVIKKNMLYITLCS
jgi:hypothetical protein